MALSAVQRNYLSISVSEFSASPIETDAFFFRSYHYADCTISYACTQSLAAELDRKSVRLAVYIHESIKQKRGNRLPTSKSVPTG